jgi:TonB family protein
MTAFLKWIQPSQNGGPESAQRQRLQLALVVLVVALFVVVIRDIHDMSPPVPVNPEPVSIAQTSAAPPAGVTPEESTPAPTIDAPAKGSKSKQARVKRPVIGTTAPRGGNDVSAGPTILATDRAILPPLEVSVVAGNQHRSLPARSNSVDVDMQNGSPPETAQSPQPTEPSATAQADVTPKVTLSHDVADRVSHSVAPSYPLLAKQMKVQGAVVLQALIDKGGHIQSLHVVSGPAILAAAAQEAVKQWRFRPYYQDGQAVETEARVSVNFTISTF